jgi:hypothetical protein
MTYRKVRNRKFGKDYINVTLMIDQSVQIGFSDCSGFLCYQGHVAGNGTRLTSPQSQMPVYAPEGNGDEFVGGDQTIAKKSHLKVRVLFGWTNFNPIMGER